MRRAGAVLGRSGVYLLVFLVVAALDSVVATTWVRPDLVPVVGTLVWAVSPIVFYVARPWPYVNARAVWLLVAWLLSALLMFLAAAAFWAVVLDMRGVRTVGTVAEVHRSSRGPATYTLRRAGEPVAGRLGSWPEDRPAAELGDAVIVVLDPGGLVDPRLPAEVPTGGEALAALAVAALIVAGPCIGAARAHIREKEEAL
ncbi:hypothetical protein AB0C29_28185 [Actinoplanes sp. NPDC048791]|uniref:hypothetical protein n=1 Tax=Actinoplanes sp. NPDC048791 TaxID=3154623 RepID=UPI0033CF4DFE